MAGNELGRRIYHMTWDFQDGKWQAMSWRQIYHKRWDVQDGKWQVMRWEDELTTRDETSKMGNGRQWDWKTNLPQGDGTSKMGSGRSWDGKTNLPQEMGRPRSEVAANEMGRQIYHMTCHFQDGKWQVMRWEDEFTTRDETSKIGSGR